MWLGRELDIECSEPEIIKWRVPDHCVQSLIPDIPHFVWERGDKGKNTPLKPVETSSSNRLVFGEYLPPLAGIWKDGKAVF